MQCSAMYCNLSADMQATPLLHADHDVVGRQNLAVTVPDCVTTPTLPQVVDALRCLPQEAALRALNHLAQAVSSIQISTVRRCAAQCIQPAICRAQDYLYTCVPSRRAFTHDAARTSWMAAMACHPPSHLCHLTEMFLLRAACPRTSCRSSRSTSQDERVASETLLHVNPAPSSQTPTTLPSALRLCSGRPLLSKFAAACSSACTAACLLHVSDVLDSRHVQRRPRRPCRRPSCSRRRQSRRHRIRTRAPPRARRRQTAARWSRRW